MLPVWQYWIGIWHCHGLLLYNIQAWHWYWHWHCSGPGVLKFEDRLLVFILALGIGHRESGILAPITSKRQVLNLFVQGGFVVPSLLSIPTVTACVACQVAIYLLSRKYF